VAAPGGGSGSIVTDHDIISVLSTLYPYAEVTARADGDGEFTVTVSSSAARELGIGTRSSIAEWYFFRALGVPAGITSSRVITRQDRGSVTEFTLKLEQGAL
jgi:hypothetical protein